jgi:hypothetical protein
LLSGLWKSVEKSDLGQFLGFRRFTGMGAWRFSGGGASCNWIAKQVFHFFGEASQSAVFSDRGVATILPAAADSNSNLKPLHACSACAGDYEDPDVTVWIVDDDLGSAFDGAGNAKNPRQDADEQSGRSGDA